jgi:hypothetical protein
VRIARIVNHDLPRLRRRRGPITPALRQKEAAMKAFDEKLAKRGYEGEHDGKRSHHKDGADKKASE